MSYREALVRINYIQRGWANYFKHAVAKHTFSHLQNFIWWRMINWVMRRNRMTWRAIQRWLRTPQGWRPIAFDGVELFKMAKRGFVLLPPEGRLSLIHVDDLARLLLALADPAAPKGLLVEPDDGRHGGWTHEQFGQALGKALGRRVTTFSTPRPILNFCAGIDRLVRRDRAKLTADRVAYFCHPDWMVDPGRGAPDNLWKPRIDTMEGLADTVRWYRQAGWL